MIKKQGIKNEFGKQINIINNISNNVLGNILKKFKYDFDKLFKELLDYH